MFSDFEKSFFWGTFGFFYEGLNKINIVFGHFRPLMTVVGENKSYS